MYTWFQNLNEAQTRLFHFRGSVGAKYNRIWFRYEICSGPSIRLKYQHGEAGDSGSTVSIGLFFITLYLSFSLPDNWYFKRKCIATWENPQREFYLTEGREYGFYFFEWAFVWHFHAKVMESSSSDPWWMHAYICLDELIFGKWELICDEMSRAENEFFKIGNKEFKMDSIQWMRNRRFRQFIPYSFYHQIWYSVKMEIKDPPLHSGKGENSWDCGDDGSYGLSCPWEGEIPGWRNLGVNTKNAVALYVDSVNKTTKRYGGSNSERGIRADLPWEYVGQKQASSDGPCLSV